LEPPDNRELRGSVHRALELDRELRRQIPASAAGASSAADLDEQLSRLADAEITGDQLSGLAARAAGGDDAARQALVEHCLPLVVRAARRYAGRDVELADLVQEGVLGVLRAAGRFESDRGVPFAAYASWWLRQSMQQAIAEQSRAVRLPAHVLWDIHRLREARGEALAISGRGPTAFELQRTLDWSAAHLDDVLRAERPALSMEAAYSGDEGEIDSLGDLIADPLSDQAFEDVITGASAEAVRTLLATLTERERQVLAWRFGLDGEELSLRQIARRLGVSAERVRQIEQRSLIKLRTFVLPAGVDD
jgi:RNA polymerase primary sigma factor